MGAGAGELDDPSVRRLIEPNALALLDRLPGPERVVVVGRADGHAVAAAAGRLDRHRDTVEVFSIGCVRMWQPFDPTADALRGLRLAAAAAGHRAVFDPEDPPSQYVLTALRRAGFHPHARHWLWFAVNWDQARRMRAGARFTRLPRYRLIGDLSPAQRAYLEAHGEYAAHPNDVAGLSPVILSGSDQPVALMIARSNGDSLTLHWGWVSPDARGRGVVLQAGAIVYDLISTSGWRPPIRFRVLSSNKAMLAVLAGPLSTVLTPLPATHTWVAPVALNR